MTRSRLVVLSALVVVGTGSALAVGAFFLDPARAAVGPLPAEALWLPADATFVMAIDVKRFVASPCFRKYGQGKDASVKPFAEFEEKTGIDPRRDVDQVVVSGSKGAHDSGVVLVLGRFDRARLSRAVETDHKGNVTWKKVGSTTEYVFREESKDPGALAFLEDGILVVGSAPAVESVIASHDGGQRPLGSNAHLLDLVAKVRPGSTFWMAGDQALLAKLPGAISAPGGNGGNTSSMTLPALRSLIVTGDLDPDVALNVTGEAADEPGARNLADLVRGFVAMAALQAGQKPELKTLADSVSVTTEANQVHLSAHVPYALLDALHGDASGRRAITAPSH